MARQQFFDLQYQNAEVEVMHKGCILYHGFQGELPSLSDEQALWISLKEAEAQEYSHFSNRKRKGGVLTLRLSAEQRVLVGTPNGHGYLMSINSADHRIFAEHLHHWANRNGTWFIRESRDCYIAFRARTDFEILSITKWSDKGVD